jgi:CRISPR-associated endonuclease/helicase Cas3
MISTAADAVPTRAWLSVWAKTGRDPHDTAGVTRWLPLHQHLADSAGIAGLLVDHWVSPQVVSRIARDLDGNVADVRLLVAWLAGVHDVGKASPAFAVQALKEAPGLIDGCASGASL